MYIRSEEAMEMNARCIAKWMILLGALTMGTASAQTPSKVVDIKAPDGIVLKGTYYAGSAPGPGILMLHQCNADRKVYDALASDLAGKGFHVLTVDFRGFGESQGDKLQGPAAQKAMLETWPGDVDAAYQFLTSQPGTEAHHTGALGASCGVNQAVQLAVRHPDVSSLVLLSGGTNPAGVQFLETHKSVPVLTAASDDDGGGGMTLTMKGIAAFSGDSKSRMIRYDTGGHGAAMFAPHPDLPQQIVAWFEQTVKK
jgi:dienelactone hydrolase